jgi:hypothetical protein
MLPLSPKGRPQLAAERQIRQTEKVAALKEGLCRLAEDIEWRTAACAAVAERAES